MQSTTHRISPLQEQETSLVNRLQQQESSSLADLYDLYGGMTWSLLLRMVRDARTAEDLQQETYLRVWTRIGLFDPAKGALGPWVLAIARNQALDHLRSRAGRPRTWVRETLDRTEDPRLLIDLQRDVDTSHNVGRVQGALAKLTEDQRSVLDLAYFEGHSQTEIAAKLGQPLGTVKTWSRSALLQLREELWDLSAFARSGI